MPVMIVQLPGYADVCSEYEAVVKDGITFDSQCTTGQA